MALTWSNVNKFYRGPLTMAYADVLFDSSYAAGGEAIVPADCGFTTVLAIWPCATAGYNCTYSKTNDVSGKLAIYAASTPDTNSATAAPIDSSIGRAYSTVTISVIVVGLG